MQTPFPDCYWVVPGRFLAGEYPRDMDDTLSFQKLKSILDSGITVFIDLTEQRDGLAPYTHFLNKLSPGNARCINFPIRDLSVPKTKKHMVDILDAIDEALGKGQNVYVHCWGGVGRTGTVVGCWLARHGFEGKAALKQLHLLWLQCAKSRYRNSPETHEQKEYIINWRETLNQKLIDRYKGCLLGLAVGDAVGTTLEFKPPGTFKPISDMIGVGPFNLKPGEWTDDTSMALCLAESLLERHSFDPADQMKRYVMWMDHGHLSSNGVCFDIGSTVRQSLSAFKRTGNPYSGPTDPHTAGNGSIMRLAPVPMFYAASLKDGIHFSGESSRTTHGARTCIDACRYFGGLIIDALMGGDKNKILSPPDLALWKEIPLCPEIAQIANGSFKTKNTPDIKGTGYVVQSLEAALWAFHNSSSFEEGCLMAVNLGDDADTTGAVYGQIAGAYYGKSDIPEKWLKRLAYREMIEEFASGLYLYGMVAHLPKI
jgi:ADP-ribosylglycohydrolase